jgi:membrane-bound serine protease (ClpP class)
MSATTIIALVVAGFLLLFFEVFIPGGVIGALGGMLVMVAVVCAFVFQGPTWGATLLVLSGLLGLIGFWLWIKLIPKTPLGRRLMLDHDAREWKSSDVAQQDLEGKEGVAQSTLRPAGTALIDGVRVDVITRGEMIAARTRIKVIAVEGNRVVVTTLE